MRGSGGMEGESLEGVHYEGYGPDGVAVMVECMTNAKLACAVVGPLQSGNKERRMACSFAGVAVRP